jgi:hypothetical protein
MARHAPGVSPSGAKNQERVGAPVPYRNVQVPQVLRYLLPPSLLALAFGAQLGTGFLTRYTYSTHTAAMLLLPLAINDPAVIVMTVVAFALGKGLVVIASAGTTSDGDAENRRPAAMAAARLADHANG